MEGVQQGPVLVGTFSNSPEVCEVRNGYLLLFRKYKCVIVFFVQSLPGLTLSL